MNKNQRILIEEIQSLIKGKQISDLIDFETDNIYNKSGASVIIRKYIKKNSSYGFESLKKNKIILKFIGINPDYKCYEAMSFSTSTLYNLIFEEWYSNDLTASNFKKQLDNYFLFVPIIKNKKNGLFNNTLEWKIGEFNLWKPDKNDLDLIGKEWSHAKNIVKQGVKLMVVKHGKSFRTLNNLPKQSETEYIHLRPHAKNSFDYDLQYLNYTNGDIKITKQSFWLNKKLINKLLKEYEYGK